MLTTTYIGSLKLITSRWSAYRKLQLIIYLLLKKYKKYICCIFFFEREQTEETHFIVLSRWPENQRWQEHKKTKSFHKQRRDGGVHNGLGGHIMKNTKTQDMLPWDLMYRQKLSLFKATQGWWGMGGRGHSASELGSRRTFSFLWHFANIKIFS